MTERAMSKIPPKDPRGEMLHLPDEAETARTQDNAPPPREPPARQEQQSPATPLETQ